MEYLPINNLSFPPPGGRYHVGLKKYHWEREVSLPKQSPSKYSSPCKQNALTRPMVVSVWYPVDEEDLHSSRMNSEDITACLDMEIVKSHIEQSIQWEEFTHVRSSSLPDAVPANLTAGSIPLLIYSHGIGMNRTAGIMWCEDLASHGFVIAAVEHFGFAASGECHFEREKVLALPMMEIRNIYHQDIKYILDSLESKAWSDEVSQLVDMQNIGIFGHSIGGGAAWQLLWQEERFKAALSMDGLLTNRVFTKLKNYLEKPLLIFISERRDALDDPEFFPAESGPGHEMSEADADHFIHSINPVPVNTHIRVSANFPRANVTNISIAHSRHFSFSSRILLKDYLVETIAEKNEVEESTTTEELTDSSIQDVVKPPTIWDIVGAGDKNLNTSEFIDFVRRVTLVFFRHHLAKS